MFRFLLLSGPSFPPLYTVEEMMTVQGHKLIHGRASVFIESGYFCSPCFKPIHSSEAHKHDRWVHFVTQQAFTKPLIIARYNYRGWKYSKEQDSHSPCLLGAKSHSAVNGGISQEKMLLSSTGRCPKGNTPGTTVSHGRLWRGTRSCLAMWPCPLSFLFLVEPGRLWCVSASTCSFLYLFPNPCPVTPIA